MDSRYRQGCRVPVGLCYRQTTGFHREEFLLEPPAGKQELGGVSAVAGGESDVVAQGQGCPLGLIGPQVGMDLLQQAQCLAVVDGVGEARGMVGTGDPLAGDLADADGLQEVVILGITPRERPRRDAGALRWWRRRDSSPGLSPGTGLFLHLHRVCRGGRVVDLRPLASIHPSTPWDPS